MNKTVKKVFLLIGLLVLIFLIWQIVFNDGGIVKTVYNAMAGGINGQWAKVAGDGKKLVPEWGDTSANKNADGKGFTMDTKGDGKG